MTGTGMRRGEGAGAAFANLQFRATLISERTILEIVPDTGLGTEVGDGGTELGYTSTDLPEVVRDRPRP